ncbi:hypothetical protein [Tranquillimonas alkanivorans]|uniref:Methyl-accepting chemotaxis protein n=1 Tax=Tranquillimonas alkanivorans TaxID=441119 RepID=A0A1I5M462_9RHOB|nr:hypothetical protein [Tranquillimonas alkanivorans]SFP04273.1 hypothetical protein SAMN04488047_10284 [Tranquillimonas alkanivorans]
MIRDRRLPPTPRGVLRDVARLRQRTERDFDRSGQELFAATELLDRMHSSFGEVAEFFAPANLQRLGGVARDLTTLAEGAEAGVAAFRTSVGELGRAVDAARLSLRDLRLRTHTAAMVSLNARVLGESFAARDPALDGFGQDMRRLSRDASDAVEDLVTRMEDGARGIEGLTRDAVAMDAVISGTILPRLRDFAGLLLKLEAEGAQLQKTAAGISDRVQAVRRGVSDVVSQLQSGDATRQRLEHVETMLDRRDGEVVTRAVLALASAQLHAAAEEVRGALDRTGRSLNEVHQNATTLASAAGGALPARGGGAGDVERLGAEVATLRESFAACRGHERRIGTAARPLHRALDEILDQSRQIADFESSMTLIGLNAILVSSRLGQDGSAMTEVSQQLRDVSRQISASYRDLLDAIRRIGAQKDRLGTGDGDGDAIWSEAQADAGLDALDGIVTDLRERRATTEALIGRCRDEVLTPLREAEARLRAFRDATGALDAAAEAAARLADGAAPAAHPDLMAELRRLYTMEAERQVHDRVAGHAPFETETSPAEPAEDDIDNILF